MYGVKTNESGSWRWTNVVAVSRDEAIKQAKRMRELAKAYGTPEKYRIAHGVMVPQ